MTNTGHIQESLASQLSPLQLNIIEATRKAPSSHGCYPFRVETPDEKTYILHLIKDEILPASDPTGREAVISMGAWLENMLVAAENSGYKVDYKLNGETLDNLSVNVELTDKTSVSEETHENHEAIFSRRTDRAAYETTLTEKQINTLDSIGKTSKSEIHIVIERSQVEALAEIVGKGQAEITHDKNFTKELAQWMKTPAEAYRDGEGMIIQEFGIPGVMSRVIKYLMRSGNISKIGTIMGGAEKKKTLASGGIAFLSADDNITGWLEGGRHMQEHLLLATRLGLRASFLTVLIESDHNNQVEEITQIKNTIAAWRLGVRKRTLIQKLLGLPASMPREAAKPSLNKLLLIKNDRSF